MKNADILAKDSEYILHTYARSPVVLESGSGATARSFDGGEYIDFTSGIGVNSLGFCDGEWAAAVAAQAARLQHASNYFAAAPVAALAEKLVSRSGMKKVFFANSGAEANEGAFKAARKYSFEKYGPGRNVIVSLKNSFHGRTMATVTATGQAAFHEHFFPFPAGFRYALAEEAGLSQSLTGDVCAVVIEIIQGEGGVVPLGGEFLARLGALCAERDILLIVDEIQTGVGRTGKFFAYEHFGLKPDIVTLAKGIAGGLPMGAVLFGEKTEAALAKGDHGSTFGGNPVCAAGANVVMDRVDGEFLKSVTAKGALLKSLLEALPGVESVSGMGLMLGAVLKGKTAAETVAKGAENGVLMLTAKEKLRFLPPLTITEEEIREGARRLAKCLEEEA